MDESEVLKWEKQVAVPAQPTKLSDAIRIGARFRPQGFGYAFSNGKSCALGAAYEGRTGRALEGDDFAELARMVPEGYSDDGHSYGPFGRPIVEMNDDRRMSRESIADWLESKGL